jgi:Rieske [2Fe-2S] domain
MALQRVDRLKEPPVVGRWYLVPAILWDRNAPFVAGRSEKETLTDLQLSRGARWWPVWGNKHSDVEHFNFPHLHYHVDPRFLTRRHIRETTSWSRTVLQSIQASPLNHADLKSGPPKPQLRRMRCSLSHSEWGFADAKAVIALNAAFTGKQCPSGKRGFVCPHKHFPLGTVESVNGVVTCPLHGMRIDAATGVCLGSSSCS